MKNKPLPKLLLLIDGDCMLCNSFLQFVLKNNTKQNIYFTALQSEIGQYVLNKHNLPTHLETVVFIQHEQAYTHSKAILKIFRHLKWWGKPLYFLGSLIPSFLADKAYKWIASNRYLWFGKTDTCSIPSPETKERLLA